MGGAGWVAAPHPGEPELFGSEPSAYLPPGGKVTNRAGSYWQRHLNTQQRYYNQRGGEAQSAQTCLFRSHEPGFAVLIAVNPHAAHPEPHRRSASLPSLCHPWGSSGVRHRPAGCTRRLFSSEHIHGGRSRSRQTGGV